MSEVETQKLKVKVQSYNSKSKPEAQIVTTKRYSLSVGFDFTLWFCHLRFDVLVTARMAGICRICAKT
jgi:hypothetical protein